MFSRILDQTFFGNTFFETRACCNDQEEKREATYKTDSSFDPRIDDECTGEKEGVML